MRGLLLCALAGAQLACGADTPTSRAARAVDLDDIGIRAQFGDREDDRRAVLRKPIDAAFAGRHVVILDASPPWGRVFDRGGLRVVHTPAQSTRRRLIATFTLGVVAFGGWHLARTGSRADSGEVGSSPAPIEEVPRRFASDPTLRDPGGDRVVPQELRTLGPPRYVGGPDDFGRITALQSIADFLFVGDALIDPHVAVIDLRTGVVLDRAGRHGRGPTELEAASAIQPGLPGSVSVWIHDFANRRVSLAVLTDSVLEITRTMPLAIATSVEDPVPLAEGWVAVGLYGDEAVLVFFDRNGRPTARVGRPPYSMDDVRHGIGVRLVNRAAMSPNPARTRLAVAFYSASRLDIYDADGELLRSVQGPRDVDVRFHVADNRFFWDQGNELAYTAVTAHGGAIMALFCGCPLGGDEQATRNRMHAWTWEGEFIGEYDLGPHPVYTIATRADGTALFGAVKEPYPRVAVWDLPPELR